jgi:hypothetical protein
MVFDGNEVLSVRSEAPESASAFTKEAFMMLNGDQPLTVPPDRLPQSVPNGLSSLGADGTAATGAVPHVPDSGTGRAARPAPRRGHPDDVVASARSGTTPAVAQGRHTGRSARPQRRGPKTAAGKARVALNALTHGLSTARLVVPGASTMEWETYRHAVVDALVPTGPVETALAERVASALWRLHRVTAYEEAAIAERQGLATASARLLPHPLDIDKIIRYEAHLTRQLYQALHQLEAMRAERHGQPAPLLRVDVHGAPDRLAAAEALPS